ncbi:hypothetical protein GBA52_010584 [Prunus armeniaca]|nr:hypothetical protein GBA52_010584 [Prunus armeniaca]
MSYVKVLGGCAYNLQVQSIPPILQPIFSRKCGSLKFLLKLSFCLDAYKKKASRWIKLNFDGSVINSQATIGFVIKNSEGHVLLVDANNMGENSINVAESVALQDGLATAIDKDWHQIVVEGLDHLSKAILICWQIWETGNNLSFRDTQPHLASCIHVAATAGWIKLNFDGSVINSQATIDFVIKNSEGHVLLVGANNIGWSCYCD